MIIYRWGFDYGWEYLRDEWWWVYMCMIGIVHFVIVTIIREYVLPRMMAPGTHERKGDLILLSWPIIWIPFLLFAFWFFLTDFSLGQKWIRNVFYFRFEWWIVKIGFTWFWDPIFTFYEWVTGYTTKLYTPYKREYIRLRVLKEGCAMYKVAIMANYEETAKYRAHNHKYVKYTFGPRGKGYIPLIKDAAFREREINHLILRHNRFINTIEAFADLGLHGKRSVNPKILQGALLNIDREMRLWRGNFRKYFIVPINPDEFGPEIRIKGLKDLPLALLVFFFWKVSGWMLTKMHPFDVCNLNNIDSLIDDTDYLADDNDYLVDANTYLVDVTNL